VGEPAGELFDTAARDDQHEYFDKSLREVGHGICRAAPGAPPPLKTPNSGRWDRPGFVVASPWFRRVFKGVSVHVSVITQSEL
jgi:hypothetical protein